MPALRVRLRGESPQFTKRVELCDNITYREGILHICAALNLPSDTAISLSLNTKDVLHLDADDRLFSAVRAGDLVWVIVTARTSKRTPTREESQNSTRSSQISTTKNENAQPMNTLIAPRALAQCCNRDMPSSQSSTCEQIVLKALIDFGFSRNQVDQTNCETSSKNSESGCSRRYFKLTTSSLEQTLSVTNFRLGNKQIIYAKLLGSHIAARQLVIPNSFLEESNPSNLSQVYCKVQDHLAVWAANAAHVLHKLPQNYGLLSLTNDTLAQIFSHLGFQDLVGMRSVCKRLQEISSAPSLWENLLRTEFGKEVDEKKDPQVAFREALRHRRRVEEALRSPRPSGYRTPAVYRFHTRAPRLASPARPVPNLVGGDIDRLPAGIPFSLSHSLQWNSHAL